jgi:hypothetical protein
VWPVKAKKQSVSSPFGKRTLNGVTRIHAGIDISATKGTPVYACSDGGVTFSGVVPDGGNQIILYHPAEKLYSCYAHMDSRKVATGAAVKKGQQIGTVGATGAGVTGPHLHYGLSPVVTSDKKYLPRNKAVDPLLKHFWYVFKAAYDEAVAKAKAEKEAEKARQEAVAKAKAEHDKKVAEEAARMKAEAEEQKAIAAAAAAKAEAERKRLEALQKAKEEAAKPKPLYYVETIVDELRVRAGPGLSYKILSFMPKGQTVGIWATKKGIPGMLWGQTSAGRWICINSKYAKKV